MGRRVWNKIGLIWGDVILCGEPQVYQGCPNVVVAPHLEVVPPLDMVCLLEAMFPKAVAPSMAAWILTDWMAERCGLSSLKGEVHQGSLYL